VCALFLRTWLLEFDSGVTARDEGASHAKARLELRPLKERLMATKKATKKAAKKSSKKSTSRSSAKKSSKKSTRKYSPAAGKEVETEMHEMKRGKLKSGRGGKKVTNPKQAIAIGLSKARKKGEKVPKKK
jgi:hypothetical protein